MTEQKVWLVTGASSGLGLTLAKRILARGDLVIATARNTSRFSETLPNVDPDRIHILKLDLNSSFTELQKTAEEANARWGRIDVLVNNAGHLDAMGPSEEMGADLFMRYMTINIAGMINVTNAVLPYMRARRQGTIAVVGSRSGYRNEFTGISAYAACKAAQHSYGETLAAELKPFGIRVVVVVPGSFKTTFSSPEHHPNTIADYADAYTELERRLQMLKEIKGSDLDAGMDAIVDVVRGEGRAAGKDGWPRWLVLGDDGIADVRARAENIIRTLDTWGDVGSKLVKAEASDAAGKL